MAVCCSFTTPSLISLIKGRKGLVEHKRTNCICPGTYKTQWTHCLSSNEIPSVWKLRLIDHIKACIKVKNHKRKIPTSVKILASKKGGKPRFKKKRKKNEAAWKLMGVTAVSGAMAAGLMATIVAISGPLICLAGLICILSIFSAVLTTAMALFPLLPIFSLLMATGLPSKISYFAPMLLDRVLCVALVMNFTGAMLSFIPFLKQKNTKYVAETDQEAESQEKFITALSLIPGINGLSWVLAQSHVREYLSIGESMVYWKNSVIYGLPGILSIMKYVCFPSLSIAPALIGNAWWLSLLLGAVHLNIEQKKLDQELAPEIEEKSQKKGKGYGENIDIDLDSLQQDLASEEFDALLRKKPSNITSKSPEDWTTGDVVSWLQKNGFSRYATSFLNHDIDGKLLLQLTSEELSNDLSIYTLGDRKRLLRAISEIKQDR